MTITAPPTGAPAYDETPTLAADSVALRRALGHFATGVTVVSTVGDGRPVGMTCQAFQSVSLDPPLVSVTLSNRARTLAAIRARGRFAVNVLGDHQQQLSRRFGSSGTDKWAGVAVEPSPSGLPLLPACLLWLDCDVELMHPAGDHTIVLGRVDWRQVGDAAGSAPLLFYRGDYATPAPDRRLA